MLYLPAQSVAWCCFWYFLSFLPPLTPMYPKSETSGEFDMAKLSRRGPLQHV